MRYPHIRRVKAWRDWGIALITGLPRWGGHVALGHLSLTGETTPFDVNIILVLVVELKRGFPQLSNHPLLYLKCPSFYKLFAELLALASHGTVPLVWLHCCSAPGILEEELFGRGKYRAPPTKGSPPLEKTTNRCIGYPRI